jgi:hypothetical protein
MIKRQFIILCLLATVLGGCVKSRTSVDKQVMLLADTYVDVILLKGKSANLDSVVYQHRLDSVLQRHGYTRQRFQEELKGLSAKPEQLPFFHDTVQARLSHKH